MQIHELNYYEGNLGSGSFIAVDNGTDTGKLSTAELLSGINQDVIQLDHDLNARIDNIIAGGDAPSEAEIIDARRGANGVDYASLGDAIRGQVGDLTDEIDRTVFHPWDLTKLGEFVPKTKLDSGGGESAHNSMFLIKYIPVEEYQQYFFYCQALADAYHGNGYDYKFMARGIRYYDSDKVMLSENIAYLNSPIATPLNCAYVTICFQYYVEGVDTGTYWFTGNNSDDHVDVVTFQDGFIQPSLIRGLVIEWENGQIDPSTGINVSWANRKYLRNKGFIEGMKDKTIRLTTLDHKLEWHFLEYDSDGNFTKHYSATPYVGVPYYWVPGSNKVRLYVQDVSSNPSPDIEPSDTAINSLFSVDLDQTYIEKHEEIEKTILSRRVAVSDMFNYLCGDGSQMVIDNDTAMAYVLYNTSDVAYGEGRKYIALAVFPIAQPFRAKHYKVFETNKDYSGVTFDYFRDENLIDAGSSVRAFFDLRKTGETDRCWYYVDFDKETNVSTDPQKVQFKYPNGNTLYDMNQANMRAMLEAAGYTLQTDYFPTISSHPAQYNGREYFGIAGGSDNGLDYPCVGYTTDHGATFQITGIIPYKASYEVQMVILDGVMYILMRGGDSAGTYPLVTSTDYGETFTGNSFFNVGSTRPQMVLYDNKVLIFTPMTASYNSEYLGIPQTTVERSGVVIRIGEGTDTEDYTELQRLYDTNGILYYSVFNYKGTLYACYCCGGLYPDKGSTRKDGVWFGKIGTISNNEIEAGY